MSAPPVAGAKVSALLSRHRRRSRLHPVPRQSTPCAVATLGIDIGKNTFHLVGLDQRGAIVLQLKSSREHLERRLANLPRCLIGMEACSGSHHIARQLEALGHDVQLIPARYVKPFLKGHKNDYRDAEAIAGAAAADHNLCDDQNAGTDGFIGATTPLEMIGPTPGTAHQASASAIFLNQRFDLRRYDCDAIVQSTPVFRKIGNQANHSW
jgi:Transposase